MNYKINYEDKGYPKITKTDQAPDGDLVYGSLTEAQYELKEWILEDIETAKMAIDRVNDITEDTL
jgi:hypothetical protein